MLSPDKLKLDHLFYLSDDTGAIQHCKYSVPDFSTGYTTDDVARLLIVAGMLYKKQNDSKILDLIMKFLSFLHYGQKNDGKWKNFMNFQRKFVEDEGSEDSFGRSLWGLGYLTTIENLPYGVYDLVYYLINRALPNIESLQAIRAKAYSAVGLSFLAGNNTVNNYVDSLKLLGDSIVNAYSENKTEGWNWFENEITYANGILPYSLLRLYYNFFDQSYLDAALESLDFLDSIVMKENYLKLVGCNGWAEKGKPPAEFDEQPVDAADMVLTYTEAYKITLKRIYRQKAEKSFNWFLGQNCLNIPLTNPDTGGCFDGIEKTCVNQNQGSESLFAYMISYLTMQELDLIN